MSIGFLYVNSQLRKMKPKAMRSKPSKRTGNGKAKLKDVLKIIVIKYPNEKKMAITARTANGTRIIALALVDLNISSTRIDFSN